MPFSEPFWDRVSCSGEDTLSCDIKRLCVCIHIYIYVYIYIYTQRFRDSISSFEGLGLVEDFSLEGSRMSVAELGALEVPGLLGGRERFRPPHVRVGTARMAADESDG